MPRPPGNARVDRPGGGTAPCAWVRVSTTSRRAASVLRAPEPASLRPAVATPQLGDAAPSARLALSLLALLLLAGSFAPSRAAAWTDASVRSVKADVRVQPDGRAHVALHVSVRVHAGWLEGLELAGLDPALTLDTAAPALVTGEDGAVYAPSVTLRPDADGTTRVQLAFPRRGSPRRGAYDVALAYDVSLAHRATEASSDGDRVRVRWTLPPWETGLDGVEITLDVPGRATRVHAGDAAEARAAQYDEAHAEGRTRLRWRRPHLPRTTPWTVAADVPASGLAPALRQSVRAPAEGPQRAPTPAWPTALAASLAVLLAGALTLRARRAALARDALAVRPLVALAGRTRALALLALVAATALAAGAHPALAVVPLTLIVALLLGTAAPREDAAPRESGAPDADRAATSADLRAATRAAWRSRWLTTDALLDATTPLGWLALLIGAALVVRLHALAPPHVAPLVALAGVLAAVPLAVLTRRARPASAPIEFLSLRELAGELRASEDAPFALSLRVASAGPRLARPRLCVEPVHTPDGLVALDLVLPDGAQGPAAAAVPSLRVVVRRGSDADRALAPVVDALDARAHRDASCVARLLPSAVLDEVLSALAAAHARTDALLDADAALDDAALSALLFAESGADPAAAADAPWSASETAAFVG